MTYKTIYKILLMTALSMSIGCDASAECSTEGYTEEDTKGDTDMNDEIIGKEEILLEDPDAERLAQRERRDLPCTVFYQFTYTNSNGKEDTRTIRFTSSNYPAYSDKNGKLYQVFGDGSHKPLVRDGQQLYLRNPNGTACCRNMVIHTAKKMTILSFNINDLKIRLTEFDMITESNPQQSQVLEQQGNAYIMPITK